jgi:hypothetical protein
MARLRTGTAVSGANGLAPPMAKRPITGTFCWLNTRAVENGAACPLLEVTAHAQALGVVFPVAGVMAGLGFKGVDDALGRELGGADPAGGIGEARAERPA